VFDFVRTWFAQRGQTSSFPKEDAEFPERFRGRPTINCSGDAVDVDEFCAAMPSGMAHKMPSGLPVIDLGACLFSPEEAVTIQGCTTAFTHDVRMAATTRAGLVTPAGETELVAALDRRMRALFGRSLRLRSVAAGSCNGCESELIALGNVVFDMARFGIEFVASPRHADGIVVTGVVNANMAQALERTYEAVADPRIVIAVGACAASGGPFRGSAAARGIPPSIPVNFWIPGCPPHPLTILDGLLRLLGRMETSGSGSRPR
jgi:Ni,Fe-hydrogenase III small subunit